MKKLSILLALLLTVICQSLAHNSLKVINPNWWGSTGEDGTIEEAVFIVEPEGIYMEVDMYFTFSAAGLGYGLNDTLEIVFDFDLPTGSIVHDSWLWVDDVIVKADIMDIWQATATYEDIVDRRRDPSVLYRKPSGGYQLRVYPLAGTESRKVKITFLSPAYWTEETVSSFLPIDLLQASKHPVEFIQIVTFDDPAWPQPRLEEYENLEFQSGFDPLWGNFLYTNLFWDAPDSPLTFSVNSPLQDGIYASRWDEGADKYYQVVYSPPELQAFSNPKKLLLLFDHESANTTIQKSTLYDFVKKMLKENLADGDSFNIGYTTWYGANTLKPNWISGDSASLHNALAPVNMPIQEGSNLLVLLNKGIEFIKSQGGEGTIILFSDSDNLNSYNAGNDVNTLMAAMGGYDIPVNIINYQNLGYYLVWEWGNGVETTYLTYKNREFYNQLTLATSGTLYSPLEGSNSIWENIRTCFNDLKGPEALFDLHTNLGAGFTFHRYNVNYLGQSKYLNQPVLQTGKYAGSFPLKIEFAALTDSGVFEETIILEESDIAIADTLSREIWTGQHIAFLEGGNPGNTAIQNIIDISIEERVLSNYTAFLALEPDQGGEPCWGCWDGPGDVVIDTEEILNSENGITIFAAPNPFSEFVKLRIELEEVQSGEVLFVQIFDSFGRLVKQLDYRLLNSPETLEYTWEGIKESGQPCPSGIYYLVIQTSKGRVSAPLVLMR